MAGKQLSIVRLHHSINAAVKTMNKKYLQAGLSFASLICLLFLIVGCGVKESRSREVSSAPASRPPSAKKNVFAFSARDTTSEFQEAAGEGEEKLIRSRNENTNSTTDTNPTETAPRKSNRKVIYKSNLSINVDSFDDADAKVNQLVNKYDGFIASANLDHLQGTRRNGYWQVRVPVENYHSFMSTIGDIGTVVKRNEEASDVTAEFYDLEARIKNKLRLEERIVELLEEAKGNLARLIEVEHELARVREEIERMQGRKRLMMDVTSLTTIEIRIQEIETYQPTPAASFDNRVDTAWTTAVSQATETGQNVIVNVVRNAINIGLAVIGLLFAWLVYRIFFRQRVRSATTT